MSHFPPSNPVSRAVQELLNAASALVGLPQVRAVHPAPRHVHRDRSLIELQRLLDDLLIRYDQLVVLISRLEHAGTIGRVPVDLVGVLSPVVGGCAEASRVAAEQVRALINRGLQDNLEGAA